MTKTTTAPETRLRRLLALATASREAVELEWESEKRERIEHQVSMAIRVAIDQTYCTFPDALARVVQDDDWAGYPALYIDGIDHEWAIAPYAVTYLDEGIWLHHTLVSQPGFLPDGRWALIVPCVCGNYREVAVSDDYLLARELQHIDDHRDVCFGDCTPNSFAPAVDRLAVTASPEGAAS
ncbi:hypothetical protein ACFV3F_39280 [Streptomyces sp. NPDC059717]|uniref:hypothetical protein n=1 Tax=Streptomyces sp. NPDC059717 TaxID=3346922 RepID=UPI0036C04458